MITNLHYHQMCSGLSVAQLAKRTGIPRTQLYGYLSGNSVPGHLRRAKLARALGTSEVALTGWCDDEILAV